MERILLAEGHRPTQELVARRLADAGYEVLLADAAGPAWEIFAATHPAAAVVAADLPAEGGPHLARRLRDGEARALVLLIDKGHLGKARGIRGVLDLGANAYVPDPTGRELVDRLARLIRQSRAAGGASPRPDGIARVLAREPGEQGEVRPGVLPPLLHRLWGIGAEGILVVAGRQGTRRVFLQRGAAVDFDSDVRAESLGRWLADSGRIGEDQYLASLEALVPGHLSAGAALVAAGALEAGEPLYQALRAHLRAMVGRCAALREGRWRFHPGAEFAGEVQALEIPPLAPVLEGARAGLPLRHFAEALRPHLGDHPARTPEFQRLLPQMALGSADLRLAVAIDGRATLRRFLEGREGELRDAWSLLWFLGLTGAVAFSGRPAQGAGDARYGEAPRASRRRRIPDERAEAIRQAAVQILPGSYFKALGVDIAAAPDEIEHAYREAVERWHPDAFAGLDLGDLEELLAQILDKLNAAHRVLSSEEKRRAYLAFLLQRRTDGRRKPDVDPEAEIALKRGERALRLRRIREAIRAFRDAAERNPREPEYLAMLAFATLRDPALERSDRPRAAARVARRALALDQGCIRAVVALALAEEGEGDVPAARRRLLGALKLAPGNPVAKRALQRVNRPR